jgi:hypothetical protein
MFRVLFLLILLVFQPAMSGWSQFGGGGGGGLMTQSQSIGSGTDTFVTATVADVPGDIPSVTPSELFDALGQIDDGLKNLDELKKMAEQLRRTSPDREIELRQFQTRLRQQRQKLEEKRAELEVMGAKLRGQGKALLAQQKEIAKQFSLPGGHPNPPVMPGMPGGMMGGMGMGMGMGGMMGGGAGFGAQVEMDMRAIPLNVTVPEKMLEMVNPLMGPMGSFVYDPRTRVVILRGDKETLDRATTFIDQLARTYEEALVSKGIDPLATDTMESGEPVEEIQTIQIEALLLEGTKVEGTTSEVAGTSLPKEALAIGLRPDDLKPFGQLLLLAVGPMVLQSMIHPDKGSSIRTRLGGYNLQLAIDGPMAKVELRSEGPGEPQTLLSNTISATKLDRPILVGSVNSMEDSTVILVIRLKKI